MTDHTWTVTINYGSGDVTLHDYSTTGNLVRASSFSKTETLHKDLKPVQDKCTFTVDYKQSLANALLTLDYDQLITVSITKDSSDWFTGIIRPITDFTIDTTANRIDFEGLDNSYKLKRIPTTNGEIEGGTVSSIVDTLLTLAGYSAVERAGIPTISKTITSFRYEARDKDYWTIINDLLFSFGYVFYFDESGVFQAYDWIAASITTTGTLSDGDVINELSVDRDDDRAGIAFDPNAEFEKISVPYYSYNTETKTIINRAPDSALTADGQVTPANTTHYYVKKDGDDVEISKVENPKLYYQYSSVTSFLGAPIFSKQVLGPVDSGWSSATSLLKTYTAGDISAEIQFQYPDPGVGTYTIKWYRVDAEITYRTLVDTVEIEVPAGAKEISTKYIETQADAKNLAQAIFNRLQNSVYQYSLSSDKEFGVGEYVSLSNTALNIVTTVRVVKKKYNYKKAVDTWDYELEGASELGTLTVGVSGVNGAISITAADVEKAVISANAGLNPGGDVTNPISGNLLTDAFAPGEDGLFMTSNDMGFYDSGNDFWPVRIYNDSGTGKFKVGNATKYVEWDGSALNVKGDITADTGTIGGFDIGATSLDTTDDTVKIRGDEKRFEVLDSLANIKVALGYLDGVSTYGANDFGLYVANGNTVAFSSGAEFEDGDYSVNSDAAYLVKDAEGHEQVRLGSLGTGDVGIDIGGVTFGDTLGGGGATGTFGDTLGGGAATGTFGAVLGGGGAEFGTRGLRYSTADNVLQIKGDVYADNGYFSGELRAATGTFTGALSGATGTFTGALSAATGTFSGSLDAVDGTFSGDISGSALSGAAVVTGQLDFEASGIDLGSIRPYGTIGVICDSDLFAGNLAFLGSINGGSIEWLNAPTAKKPVYLGFIDLNTATPKLVANVGTTQTTLASF